MSAADQSQAAAAELNAFFAARVAENMPPAQQHALGSPAVVAGWLQRATAHGVVSRFGRLDEDADVLMVGSFSPPTLLSLLFDRGQPHAIVVAARDALVRHFLADTQVRAAIQADAEGLARRAVQHLAQQQEQLRRAERQSLYGGEHRVPGVAAMVLTPQQVEAMDETAGVARCLNRGEQ